MKKLILTFSMAALLIGCGGSVEEEKAATAQEEVIKKEIVAADSVTTLMDETKVEIDKKNEELDELLNDL